MVRMGRKPADLEPWKDQIRRMIKEDNLRRQDVLAFLHKQGVDIHERTLHNRLRTWDIHKHVKSDDTPELRARVRQLFFDPKNTEEVIISILRSEGWTIEQRKLSRIRHDLGLFRALTREDKANIEEEDRKIMAVIQEEIDKGQITSFTRIGLYDYFRKHEIIVSRDRLYELFKRQAPHLCNPANKPPIWRGPRPPRGEKTAAELARLRNRKPRGPRKKRAAAAPVSAPNHASAQDSKSTPQTEQNWPIDPGLPDPDPDADATADTDTDDNPPNNPEDTHSPTTTTTSSSNDPATQTHAGTIWIRELGHSLNAAWQSLLNQTASLPAAEREAFRLQYIQSLTQATEPFLRPVGRASHTSQDFPDKGMNNGLAPQTPSAPGPGYVRNQSEAGFVPAPRPGQFYGNAYSTDHARATTGYPTAANAYTSIHCTGGGYDTNGYYPR